MTSAVYANGNKATALSSIIAAVNARFTAGPDGLKRLDTASLMSWLQSEFNQISGDTLPSGASATEVAAAAQTYIQGGMVQQVNGLNAEIRPETLATRPDYPDTSPAAMNPRIVSAIVQKNAEIKVTIDRIGAHYAEAFRDDDTSLLVRTLIGFFNENQMDLRIPAAVQRLVETRAYIATYVTDLGEESAPSPVSDLIELDQNDTVEVTVPAAPSGRGISHYRLYRSLAGSEAADFQLVPSSVDVAGFPIGDLTITDDVAPERLGEICPTKTWAEPPTIDGVYLRGLIGMPNGIMAGFIGAMVAFAESYKPYAWPVEYQIVLESDVVGLGVFGQTLVALTNANPYYISGAHSSAMSAIKLDTVQACVSSRSIVSVPGGVVYASPDGLCLASSAGVQVITTPLFTREDWQALDPETIFAIEHDGTYFFWYTGGSGGCYALHLPTMRLVSVELTASAARVDKYSDTLYLASGTTVRPVFSTGRMTGTWRGKIAVLPQYAGFAWLAVLSDFSSAVTVRIYADGVLFRTATFTSSTPQRLPSGRFKEWEIEVESSARVTEVVMASSTDELQSV